MMTHANDDDEATASVPAGRKHTTVFLVGAVVLALLAIAALIAAVLVPNSTLTPAAAMAPDTATPSSAAQSSATPSSQPRSTPEASPANPSPALGTPQAAGEAPIATLANQDWTARIAQKADMSQRAMNAYAGAALALQKSSPECKIGWNMLAAIGEVETHHGTSNGSYLDENGVANPTITGPRLDGKDDTAEIRDTDGGRLDGDSDWDHAVGPMQFLPATWAENAQDGNKDGSKNVNQIDDAALAAGTYLCKSGGDLTVPENWIKAVTAYNDSTDYNHKVADAATRYGEMK